MKNYRNFCHLVQNSCSLWFSSIQLYASLFFFPSVMVLLFLFLHLPLTLQATGSGYWPQLLAHNHLDKKTEQNVARSFGHFFNTYFTWFFYFNGCLQYLWTVHFGSLLFLTYSSCSLFLCFKGSFNSGIRLSALGLLLICCSSLFQSIGIIWILPFFLFLLTVSLQYCWANTVTYPVVWSAHTLLRG